MQCNTPEEFTACMRANEYDKAYGMFDKTMTDNVSKSQFRELIKQFNGNAGKYQSYVRTGYAEHQGSKIYDVVEKYAKGTVVTRLSYNAEGKIDGLYFLDESQALPGNIRAEAAPNADRENMQCNTPEEFTACMRAGEYDKAYNLFDKSVTNGFSQTQFKAVVTQFIGNAGEYQSFIRTGYAETNGQKVYDVVEKYSKTTLVTRLSYNADGKIAGLHFLPDESQALPGNIRAGKEQPGDAKANQDQPKAAPAGEIAIRDEDAPALTDKYKESIVVVSGKDRCALDGYLTMPRNVEKPPVVILVHGSGPHDKDETIGPNKPFKDIAHGLAERGIAVLRYTKRTLAMRTDADCRPEDLTHLTVRDEVLDDVNAAIRLVQEDPQLANDKVFVLGHSMGGMLIPAIAHENPSLRGVISAAGSTTPLLKTLIQQTERQLKEAESILTDEQRQKVNKDIADLKALDANIQNAPDNQNVLGANVYYIKTFDKYIDPALYAELKIPTLLLQGANDMQVLADGDFAQYKELLKNHPAMESKLYPETNHLLMPSKNTVYIHAAEDYMVPSHVREEIIEDIAKFILAH